MIKKHSPLADYLRPQQLDEIVGQTHLIGPGKPLSHMLESSTIASILFWGPPGCGKTTIARLIASKTSMRFVSLSAIGSGVADLRKIFQTAEENKTQNIQTLLFIDEIHRFNKAQQDSFLGYMENGTIILIGATTENPSFELNPALLSRMQVYTLKRLEEEQLDLLLSRAEKVQDQNLALTPEARLSLCAMADGDGRSLLNMAEFLFSYKTDTTLGIADLRTLMQRRAPIYDKNKEGHYNLISALHKSLRGSDVDAALYWFARILAGGEPPLFLARRLVRFAVEDIGMADPQALLQANAALDAYNKLGSPEGELALAQALVYLATAPKSNAVYTAYQAAVKAAKNSGSLSPPATILNAPTQFMKDEGYAKGYIYDHDTPEGFSGQNYFPEPMQRQYYYKPIERGYEREIRKRLAYWQKLRTEKLS